LYFEPIDVIFRVLLIHQKGNLVRHLLIILSFLLLFSSIFISCSKSSDDGSSNTSTTTDDDTITINITITDDNSTYSDNGTTFTVTVSSSKYYIDGILTKSLTLKKGYTYFFDSTDSTTNNHPLFIGTISTGGSYTYEYTSGVTKSRTTTETLTFIVPSDSPSTLYYNCGNHVAMGGTITIM
jgi:hypothetical protein